MISLCINHAPHRTDRRDCLREMLAVLEPWAGPFLLNDDPATKPAGPTKVAWTKAQWSWALSTRAEHCLFMSDDLHLCPHFAPILQAMIDAKPDAILGLLSNHPRAVDQALAGARWYRTNSWVVGPAYVVPRRWLEALYGWYCALPPGTGPGQVEHLNDDSSLNAWNSAHGPHEAWHPLPTIIEHRGDIGTTWVAGDKYSRERVSWRETRSVVGDNPHRWVSEPKPWPLLAMCATSYWDRPGDMLPVGP